MEKNVCYLFMCVAELVDEAHPERICENPVISQTNNSEGNMLVARKVVRHFFSICFFPQFVPDMVNFEIFYTKCPKLLCI